MNFYQYIKILTCVCVCVTEVGCSWGGTRLVMRDLRTAISNSTKNIRERWQCMGSGMGWNPAGATSGCMQSASAQAPVEAYAIGDPGAATNSMLGN